METNNKIVHSKFLYIFFIFLSLNIFFFSTAKTDAKAFDINNIEISRPFEMKFNKNEVINEGFREAFYKLISLILNSSDQKKIGSIKIPVQKPCSRCKARPKSMCFTCSSSSNKMIYMCKNCFDEHI